MTAIPGADESATEVSATIAAVGRRLKTARTAHGLSLHDLADAAGVSPSRMAALERGDEGSTLAALCASADALGIEIAALFRDPPKRDHVGGPKRLTKTEPVAKPRAPRSDSAARGPATPTQSRKAPRSDEVPPPGYTPLEMPEMWEPAAPSPVQSRPAPPTARDAPPARTATTPPAPPSGRTGPMPRTFADLKTGALADRRFDSLQAFAVAAVLEAGHPISVVAPIFRLPQWRLENLVLRAPTGDLAEPSR